MVRLGVNSDGTMSAQDFFSPANASQLDLNDTDLGSGGPVALPGPVFGTSRHPRLLVQIGKDGRLFLLDRDDLGGRSQGPGGTDKVLGAFGPYEGVWGHPAVYGGQGGYVYTIGSGGPLRAFAYGLTGSGLPGLTNTGSSAQRFGYTSGSPVVTSTGTNPGSALVWAVASDGASGANGQLRAYDAVPVNGALRLRWSAPIGVASKFAVPATDGGRIYVGTRDGHVLAFGRPANTALTGEPVDAGEVAVGSAGTVTATVTATRDVTITGVSTPHGRPVLRDLGRAAAHAAGGRDPHRAGDVLPDDARPGHLGADVRHRPRRQRARAHGIRHPARVPRLAGRARLRHGADVDEQVARRDVHEHGHGRRDDLRGLRPGRPFQLG